MDETPKREWKLSRRALVISERTLVMGILNATPDSFSDGGQFLAIEKALRRACEMIEEGADILDIGGESTRPGAGVVEAKEEIRRVVPIIERLTKIANVPISVDTTKAEVARAAINAGAEIINDISGLRFDPNLADIAAENHVGLILMHSRGTAETMHKLAPVTDIMLDVTRGLRESLAEALRRGVAPEQIAFDPGIGFSKSFDQNLEVIARLDELVKEFAQYPLLVGTSRKSFIGRILDNAPADERVYGTMATVAAAVLRGANIVRVHDVRAALDTVRVSDAILRAASVKERV